MGVEDLLKDRGRLYGDAYIVTGDWLAEHAAELSRAGTVSYCLLMIAAKLHRALESPDYSDHYKDIAGFAELALGILATEKEGGIR